MEDQEQDDDFEEPLPAAYSADYDLQPAPAGMDDYEDNDLQQPGNVTYPQGGDDSFEYDDHDDRDEIMAHHDADKDGNNHDDDNRDDRDDHGAQAEAYDATFDDAYTDQQGQQADLPSAKAAPDKPGIPAQPPLKQEPSQGNDASQEAVQRRQSSSNEDNLLSALELDAEEELQEPAPETTHRSPLLQGKQRCC